MKNSLILNLVWLVVAAAAFFIGKSMTAKSASTAAGDAGSGPISVLGSKKTSGSSDKAAPGGDRFVEGSYAQKAGDNSPLPEWVNRDRPFSIPEIKQITEDVMKISDPIRRQLLFAELMGKLTQDTAPEVFKTMRENVNGREGMQMVALMGYAWGALDGEGAMAATKDMNGWEQGMFRTIALGGWAAGDADKAIAWFEDQEMDGRMRGWTANGLVSGLARSDPDKAMEYVMGMDEGDSRNRMVGTITSEKIKEGIGPASEWASNLSNEGGVKSSAFDEIAEVYARRDPEAAAKWITEHASEDYSEDAVGEIARTWGDKDGASAVSWLEDLPEGAVKNEGYDELFESWSDKDSQAASTYLAEMEASPARDAAVRSLTQEIAREDPEAATQWAKTIESDDLREDSLLNIGRQMYRSDQDGAMQWAENVGLSAESIEKMSQGSRRGGFGDWMRGR